VHPYPSLGQTIKIPVLRSTSNIPDTRKIKVYRCCLPTLTGFTRSRHPEVVVSTRSAEDYRCPACLVGEFNPAIADCRLQATANRPSSTAHWKIPNRLRPRKPDPLKTMFHGTNQRDTEGFILPLASDAIPRFRSIAPANQNESQELTSDYGNPWNEPWIEFR
jgi:hypothetical protein